MTPQLLQAALAEIVQAGHRRILLLGDISDDGTPEMIGAALSAIASARLECWAVPGNHDAARDSRALDLAAEQIGGCQVVHHEPLRLGDRVTVAGPGLRSDDGGQTCEATSLPDVSVAASQILLWAGHYPLLSQEGTLLAAGLRYPGDLINLRQARGTAEQHAGPILVLHGHLHTAVTQREGRILQLGFPALVEWPHAWTDLRIETSPGATTVRTAIRPVAGNWSHCGRNTLLAAPAQTWQLNAEGWSPVSAR